MDDSLTQLESNLIDSRERVLLWIKLLKTTRYIESELRDRLRREFKTTLPRFEVMSALFRSHSGLKMSDVSRQLMVSNGNVTGIVDRLAEDGMLLRETVPGDRRAALVRLTEKGRAEFTLQAAAYRLWLDELLGGLNAQDAALARSLLQSINIKSYRDSGDGTATAGRR